MASLKCASATMAMACLSEHTAALLICQQAQLTACLDVCLAQYCLDLANTTRAVFNKPGYALPYSLRAAQYNTEPDLLRRRGTITMAAKPETAHASRYKLSSASVMPCHFR